MTTEATRIAEYVRASMLALLAQRHTIEEAVEANVPPELPLEMLQTALTHLTFPDLRAAAASCQQWRQAARHAYQHWAQQLGLSLIHI